eukprot:gene1061-631_t
MTEFRYCQMARRKNRTILLQDSIAPLYHPLCGLEKLSAPSSQPFRTLGRKWNCIELVRRYLAARKGVWLENVEEAKQLWEDDVTCIDIRDQSTKRTRRMPNRISKTPDVGDVIVWHRPPRMKALGDMRLLALPIVVNNVNNATIESEGVLGWVSIDSCLLNPSETDVGDDYRIITGRGRIFRQPVEPQVTLPWTNPHSLPTESEFYLRRSLVDSATGKARLADVPSGFYHMDYNMWARLRHGAHSLHKIALQATQSVLDAPNAERILEDYFGIPHELHQCLRRSWRTTPAFTGRFDFGTDGSSVKLLEYNCDSSGALLECCETQEKMANYYGIFAGNSTDNALIHFFIDEDDEERYTAMCMMEAAVSAGFRAKLYSTPADFHFFQNDQSLPSRERRVLDKDDESVEIIWKTWSWDTVLHQYIAEQTEKDTGGKGQPTLPDLLLNTTIFVFEPFWKAVTGSKALLPYMYHLAPDHEFLLPCSFMLTDDISSQPYISKPVNGRAGQNITMFDGPAVTADDRKANDNASRQMTRRTGDAPSRNSFAASKATSFIEIDKTLENSSGRFYNSVVVYQRRHFLRKFAHKFSLFSSKITTLDSLVAPARVIRSDATFNRMERNYKDEDDNE